MLKKDEILKCDDKPTKKVEVPEWGGHVFVRTMSGTERDSFEQSMLVNPGKGNEANYSNIRAKLCARTICDKGGNRLFNDSDVAALGEKSAAALDRIFTVAQDLNGVSTDDVEAMVKNSESGQSESSTSG
jgi:hypothetical protein